MIGIYDLSTKPSEIQKEKKKSLDGEEGTKRLLA